MKFQTKVKRLHHSRKMRKEWERKLTLALTNYKKWNRRVARQEAEITTIALKDKTVTEGAIRAINFQGE